MFEDTIAAIATPLSQSAISIIRLSGPDAVAIADSIFSRNLKQAQSHTVSYGYIMDEGQPVDEVLVSVFLAPRTYTREDVVEINAHGGVYITRRILELLLSHGARLARPGEFTERAFLNGRIDLSQAEAAQQMTEALSKAGADQSIHAIRGSIRRLLEPLIDRLMDLIANIEVNIDYPEYEEGEDFTWQTLLPVSESLLQELDDILARSRNSRMIQNGINTVIAGKPNAGKSSLLNALLEEDKAIVTEIPGTTRDLVEGRIVVGDVLLNLIDTAGLRQSEDRIEQMGIEKSREKLEEADLVLCVLDGSRPLEEEDLKLLDWLKHSDRKYLILINKSDLPQAFNIEEALHISSRNHEIDPLLEALKEMAGSAELQEKPLLSNERQMGLLSLARKDMINAIKAMKDSTEPDLIEIDLRAAHDHLKEILGEVHREDLLDTLFSKFCLGK